MHLPRSDRSRIIQIQGSCCEVSRIGVLFVLILDRVIDHIKVRVGDRRLTAHDQMPLIRDLLRKTADGSLQMRDILADGSVSARDDLRQSAVVIRQNKRQAIQLPRQPDRAVSRPRLQFTDLFGLCQRQRRELMWFSPPLIGGILLISGLLRRAVRQDHSVFLFKCGQFIKHRIPFVIG